MYNLEQLRQLYPDVLGGLSDAATVNKISSLSGQDPQNLAAHYGLIDPDEGDASRGLGAGIDAAQAGAYGAVAWAAGPKPKEGSFLAKQRDWGYEGYKRNMAEVQLRSRPYDDITQAKGAGDVIDSAQYWLFYAIPQIVEAVAFSKGGGFVGKKTAEHQIKKELKKEYGKNLNEGALKAVLNSKATQARLAEVIPKFSKAGSIAAIGTQAVGTELGHTYGGAIDEAIAKGGTIDDVDYGRATKYGLMAGGAEFAGDVLTLGLMKVGPAKRGLKNLLGMTSKGATPKVGGSFASKYLSGSSRTINAASRGLIGAGLEAGTEMLQTGLEEMGAGKSFEEANFLDPTSAWAGAIGGGAMGLAGGALTKKVDPNEAINEALDTANEGAQEQAQEVRQTQQKQAQEQEALAAEVERLRHEYKNTFPNEKDWAAEQVAEQDQFDRLELQNPESKLSAAYREWQSENKVYEGDNESDNEKLKSVYLKQIAVKNENIQEEHLAALDVHAQLQVEKIKRSEHEGFNPDAHEFLLESVLQSRNQALEKGDIDEVVRLDQQVTSQTLPGEWDEFKRRTNKEAAAALAEAKKIKGRKTQKAEDKLEVETPGVEAPIVTEEEAKKEETPEELTLDNMFKLEELSPQQRMIFDFIKKAAAEGDANEYYTVAQTKGKVDKSKGWSATKIAKALGLPGKGNVINQIKRINEKARAIYGKDVDDLMLQMAQKEKDAGDIEQITSETDLEAEFESEALKEFEEAKKGEGIDLDETPDAIEIGSAVTDDQLTPIGSAGGGTAKVAAEPDKKAKLAIEARTKKEKEKIAKVNKEIESLEKKEKEEKEDYDATQDPEAIKRRNETLIQQGTESQKVKVILSDKRYRTGLADEWNNRKSKGKPDFDSLSEEQQYDWAITLMRAVAENSNLDTLQRDMERNIIDQEVKDETADSKPEVKGEKVVKGPSTTTKTKGTTKDTTKRSTKKPASKVRKPKVGDARAYAVEELGTKWGTTYPHLETLLKGRKFASFNTMVKTMVSLETEAGKFETAEDFMYAEKTLPITSVTSKIPREKIISKIGKIKSKTPDAPVVVTIEDGKLMILDGNQRYYQKIDEGAKTIQVVFTPENDKQLIAIWESAEKGVPKKGGGGTDETDEAASLENISQKQLALILGNEWNGATQATFEGMFKKLLGKKGFERIKNRVVYYQNVEEAEKDGHKVSSSSVQASVSKAYGPMSKRLPGSGFRSEAKAKRGDRITFILDNIHEDDAGPTFIHEVGGHIGWDNIFSPSETAILVKKIRAWAKEYDAIYADPMGQLRQPEPTDEQISAHYSITHVNALLRDGGLPTNYPVDHTSPITAEESTREYKEIVAYFITDAMERGIIPEAADSETYKKTTVGVILHKFRVAFRKFIGYQKGENDNLTVQDIMNMVYGAANLELAPESDAAAETRLSMDYIREGIPEPVQLPPLIYGHVITPAIRKIDNIFKSSRSRWGSDVEVRVVGGAVRDILLGRVPKDIDLATNLEPGLVQELFENNNIKVLNIPSGLEHGTVTVVIDGENFEITSLRRDVKTRGSRAEVEFGYATWEEDAARRDLTYNAMSMDFDGNLYDNFNGRQDLFSSVTRFVGDPEARVQEDYLRILRYFRFQGNVIEEKPSWDPDVLKAISRHADGLRGISDERLWMEMSKILSGRNVVDILNNMHQTGVLRAIGLRLPIGLRGKIDSKSKGRAVKIGPIEDGGDPVVALAKLGVAPVRLRLSNAEKARFKFMISHKNDTLTKKKVNELMARLAPREILLDLAKWQGELTGKDMSKITDYISSVKIPDFPITGKDLIDRGMEPGPELGNLLFKKKQAWIESGFAKTKEELLTDSMEGIWDDKIDLFVSRNFPKNEKGKYIPDAYLSPAEYSAFQKEQWGKEKKFRAGLEAKAKQYIDDAVKHEKAMYDPDDAGIETDESVRREETKRVKKEAREARDWVADKTNPTITQVFTDATNLFQMAADKTKFLHQFINEVKDIMPSAKKWHDNVLAAEKTRNAIKQMVDDIGILARDMSLDRLKKVNQFIEKSTVEQLWGYNPYDDEDSRQEKVVIDTEMKSLFSGLDSGQQHLVRKVFAHGDKMLARKRKIALAFGVEARFFGVSGLEGPYAPLRRFGNYVTEFKSQKLLDAEAKLREQNNITNRSEVAKRKAQARDYEIRFHPTMGKARRYADENGKKFAYAEASPKTKIVIEGRSPDYKVLQKVLANLNALAFTEGSTTEDKRAYEAVKGMVNDMYFETLDEESARRSQAKRKGLAGYEGNMMRSFISNATAEANLIANMEHGTEINTSLLKAQQESSKQGARGHLGRVYNMLVSHYAANLSGKQTPIQDRLAALNTVYMLTSSIGYHVTNATQPMMVTIPKLVGDFGAGNYGKALKLYAQGMLIASDIVEFNWKTLKLQTKIDIRPDHIPKKYLKYQPLLEELQLRQLLDVGIEQDLAEFNQSETGYEVVDKTSGAMSNIAHRLYQVARLVEAYNRISTVTAAWEMAEANKHVTKRLGINSTEYAITMVEDTQGNFSSMDAPWIIKKMPKLMGQYRKYQIMMAWVYADATKKAMWGASPHEKAAGKRTMAFMLGHAGLFAGMTGVPFMNLVAYLFSAIGGDEEPEDLERWIYRNVGDGTLGTIIARGLPSVFGIDMSTKLSQNKIFYPLPYTDYSLEDGKMEEAFFEAVTGPFGTTLTNFGRSLMYAKDGNFYRSLEYALPKGARTALESYRLGTEGYSLRNGDIMTDDFSGWQLALNALGIPATGVNRIKWTRGQQYELNEWFKKRQSKLRRQYVDAKRDGNRSTMKDLIQDWKDLQKAKDRVRPFFHDARSALKRTALSSLLKAPRKQEKREEMYREQLGTN